MTTRSAFPAAGLCILVAGPLLTRTGIRRVLLQVLPSNDLSDLADELPDEKVRGHRDASPGNSAPTPVFELS